MLDFEKWSGRGNNAIRDVWAFNLEEEFKNISNIIDICPFVAMDTEFPGIVARPLGQFRTTRDFYYQTLRCNVNLLKIIQLGITLVDENGNPPPYGPSTWQFNFRFCLSQDLYAQDSIDLLTASGINFEKFETDGVDIMTFAQHFTSSGLVLSPDISWLSFHSGYDFCYIVKTLIGEDLPDSEDEFFELVHRFFPNLYDIKYILKKCDKISHEIGLDALSEIFALKRIGPAHQAGSDSLLTALCFFKYVREVCPDGELPVHLTGVIYGLGEDNQAATAAAEACAAESGEGSLDELSRQRGDSAVSAQ